MKRYDLEHHGDILYQSSCDMTEDNDGEYVRHEDVQKMLIEIRSTAFIQGYKKMIDKIIEKECFEVEK